MLIASATALEKFKKAVMDLASGSLLLQVDKSGTYFSTDRIYCNYAGYEAFWSDFIGYQNVLFYGYIKKLKNIATFEGIVSVDSKEQYLEDISRSQAFNLTVIVFKDSEKDICLQVNEVIRQVKPLYEKIKDVKSHEELTAILKKELYTSLPVVYAELLYLKALIEPFYSQVDLINKRLLSSENVLYTWKENEIK